MKEPIVNAVYRSRPDKKHPKGERWRFLEKGTGGFKDLWLMYRAKDGHRLYWRPRLLSPETPVK